MASIAYKENNWGKGMTENEVLRKCYDFLEKHFASTKNIKENVDVIKSKDSAQRRALFVVLSPDEVDAHGDVYSEAEVEKGCISYNTHCMKASMFHQVDVSKEKALVEQSFVNPTDFAVDDGRTIKKGAWLQWWHFPDEDMWAQVEKGVFTGVSVECVARVEDLSNE